MPTIKQNLEKVKEFLIRKIEEEDYKLPKAPEEGEQGQQLEDVYPAVAIGSIPHSNFKYYYNDGQSRGFAAPYILIGIEECTFDYDEESIPILIQACCYTVDQYNLDDEDLRIPDNMGCLDVINLLENIRYWIINEADFPVDKHIRLGTYDTKEVTYPLAFGYVTFELNTNKSKVNRQRFNYE